MGLILAASFQGDPITINLTAELLFGNPAGAFQYNQFSNAFAEYGGLVGNLLEGNYGNEYNYTDTLNNEFVVTGLIGKNVLGNESLLLEFQDGVVGNIDESAIVSFNNENIFVGSGALVFSGGTDLGTATLDNEFILSSQLNAVFGSSGGFNVETLNGVIGNLKQSAIAGFNNENILSSVGNAGKFGVIVFNNENIVTLIGSLKENAPLSFNNELITKQVGNLKSAWSTILNDENIVSAAGNLRASANTQFNNENILSRIANLSFQQQQNFVIEDIITLKPNLKTAGLVGLNNENILSAIQNLKLNNALAFDLENIIIPNASLLIPGTGGSANLNLENILLGTGNLLNSSAQQINIENILVSQNTRLIGAGINVCVENTATSKASIKLSGNTNFANEFINTLYGNLIAGSNYASLGDELQLITSAGLNTFNSASFYAECQLFPNLAQLIIVPAYFILHLTEQQIYELHIPLNNDTTLNISNLSTELNIVNSDDISVHITQEQDF